MEGIHTGIENTNYFVTTDLGRYVLTVFERLTARQLPFYLQLMLHLARKGLPVPEPQSTRSGALVTELKSKPAALITRLPGKATTEPTAAQCASVGDFLARMHLAGLDFAPFQPHLRGIGWWKSAVPKLAARPETMHFGENDFSGLVFARTFENCRRTHPAILFATSADGDRPDTEK